MQEPALDARTKICKTVNGNRGRTQRLRDQKPIYKYKRPPVYGTK